ncbi:SHOCT domain-containing protein [Thermocoleostomius sinensis]|uniref:SHOCT domain-containing protein n=1 Tax=Thermocoleostomius sinensis A174 TaxID=2016057 RepID=A0A9E8ZDL0_9CYAN|nr:SHOCT domain-containing protein [Thermocoleostomius sinensis]WAL61228.1 SHOCT domain-containing protein [Thermocoleostomius sinensis A174]
MPVGHKDRKIAALLALISTIPPLPSGLHKFYLGQMRWGVVYLLLSWTPVPKIASALEAFWYLFQDPEEFDRYFNSNLQSMDTIDVAAVSAQSVTTVVPAHVNAVAEALRQLEQLRQDGLMSEYEFEQKRRQLLDRL